MMSPLTYCKSWFRAKKCITEAWTESKARAAHDKKKLYGVVVGDLESPFCFLEINKGFVGVGFLDSHAREFLYYAFQEIAPGILFMRDSTYREYVGDTDKVSMGTTYIFREDGKVKVRKQTFDPTESSRMETISDLSQNYDTWPEFGKYDNLIKIER